MLRIESNQGRLFTLDLTVVVGITYDFGVLTFALESGSSLQIGGDEWGGKFSIQEADQIIDLWETERWPDVIEREDTPGLESPVRVGSQEISRTKGPRRWRDAKGRS